MIPSRKRIMCVAVFADDAGCDPVRSRSAAQRCVGVATDLRAASMPCHPSGELPQKAQFQTDMRLRGADGGVTAYSLAGQQARTGWRS